MAASMAQRALGPAVVTQRNRVGDLLGVIVATNLYDSN